jgi:uncharacterized protein YndB with AHSA1/START domain
MAYSIKHLFHISAKRSAVYKALTTIEGLSSWWTRETTGNAEKGGVIKFRFAGQGPDMKVIDTKTDESITWECVASPHGWVGNVITIKLDDNEGKTRVRFSHDGWQQQDDFYAICSFSWGRYMESLRQLCQAGKGEGFGTPGYRQ